MIARSRPLRPRRGPAPTASVNATARDASNLEQVAAPSVSSANEAKVTDLLPPLNGTRSPRRHGRVPGVSCRRVGDTRRVGKRCLTRYQAWRFGTSSSLARRPIGVDNVNPARCRPYSDSPPSSGTRNDLGHGSGTRRRRPVHAAQARRHSGLWGSVRSARPTATRTDSRVTVPWVRQRSSAARLATSLRSQAVSVMWPKHDWPPNAEVSTVRALFDSPR